MAASMPQAPSDAEHAREASRRLAAHVRRGKPLTITVSDGTRIDLPPSAVQLLAEALEEIAAGRGVAVVPQDAELTTQQAADALNVSRPFLVRLLEERRLPFRKVGTHRRVRLEDVLRYKETIDAERRKVLDELAAEAQELGQGY